MGKTKLKDIAEKAGCSITTVSYVLNDVQSQKINPATKKKIIQLATLLGYQKNPYATKLAGGKSNLIGIYFAKNSFSLQVADNIKVLDKIINALKEKGFDVLLLPDNFEATIQMVDAIICFGVSDQEFVTISDNNNIPVIAYECLAHEKWVFEVRELYQNINRKYDIGKDYTLVTYKSKSKKTNEEIISANPHTLFVTSYEDLDSISKVIKTSSIIVAGNELYEYLKSKIPNAIHHISPEYEMINKLVECVETGLSHVDVDSHHFAY